MRGDLVADIGADPTSDGSLWSSGIVSGSGSRFWSAARDATVERSVPPQSRRLLRPGRPLPHAVWPLRADGIAPVLDRAIADGRRPDDELWFGPGPLPAQAGLAAHHGQTAGLGVRLGPDSARYLWLDRAQRQARKHRSLTRGRRAGWLAGYSPFGLGLGRPSG